MKLLNLILFQIIALGAFAQQDNYRSIPFLAESVKINGELSDAVWEKVTPFTGFHNHFPADEGLAEQQTEVRIFHNQKFLFIGATYFDKEERNNINSLKRDLYWESMFLSDCFGIVLDPFEEGDNGYYFGVNASGVQYDALIGGINNLNDSWNTIWRSETSKKGTEKYYEIAIPLDAINFNTQKNTWGIQFFINDTKTNQFSTLVHSPRNFVQYDLRFMEQVHIDNLPKEVGQKFSVLPSIALSYSKDKVNDLKDNDFTPSIDGQYNITSSLRLDVTLNPDFSQVEVDQQVTNLSRFAINFPERRKFFLENSDLFNNLGTDLSNPFYSRRIGSETNILAGAKLSGNIGKKTRIGLLNVQTKNEDEEEIKGKNYSVLVGRQNLSDQFIASLFLVNSQNSQSYNRIGGSNLNYKSENNKWISNLNYAQAFTNTTSDENHFVNAEITYQTRKLNWTTAFQKAGKNYISETGFVPLIYNYDAATDETTREGYNRLFGEIQLKHFPKNSKSIDWMRVFWINSTAVFNEDNSFRENRIFFSPFAIRFKNSSYVYVSFDNRIEELNYNFDFLQNGNFIKPGKYNHTFGRVGYWSPNNRKFYYTVKFEFGQFYNGTRINPLVTVAYRLLPRAVLSASYETNKVDLEELGNKNFHLAKLTTEIYFSNRLNWTTYLQYNTQQDNFNINSRFQWEYKPLSYIYLVFSNNYDGDFMEKSWGISFKVNRRFDF